MFVHLRHALKMQHGMEIYSRSRNKCDLTRLYFVSVGHLISEGFIHFYTKFIKLASSEVGVDWLGSFCKYSFFMLARMGVYQC